MAVINRAGEMKIMYRLPSETFKLHVRADVQFKGIFRTRPLLFALLLARKRVVSDCAKVQSPDK